MTSGGLPTGSVPGPGVGGPFPRGGASLTTVDPDAMTAAAATLLGIAGELSAESHSVRSQQPDAGADAAVEAVIDVQQRVAAALDAAASAVDVAATTLRDAASRWTEADRDAGRGG